MGRVKGSQNKITKTVKQALLESLDRVGGVEWFVQLAQDDPKTYAQLIGRIIPLQIKADVDHTVSGILFKTVYENQPEALPSPVVDLTADIIDATVVEPEAIEIRPSPAPSSPE